MKGNASTYMTIGTKAMGGMLNYPFKCLSKAYLFTVTRKESPPATMSSPQSKHLHLTALISTAKVTGGNRRLHTTGRLIEREREGEKEERVRKGK